MKEIIIFWVVRNECLKDKMKDNYNEYYANKFDVMMRGSSVD